MPWVKAALDLAKERLEGLGLRVSFGKFAFDRDRFDSASTEKRVADLHSAFSDSKVKIVLSSIGGYNSIQTLRYLDYGLIRSNPKVFCGYSDSTALENAIFSKTGLVTYYGPHFFDFGEKIGLDYTMGSFQKCLFQSEPYSLAPSDRWSDDKWSENQIDRKFFSNPGYWAIHEGEAEGRIVGGNLTTLNALQGTDYFPDLSGSLLFLEEDREAMPPIVERNLSSLSYQKGFYQINALVFGRFQRGGEMTKSVLRQIVDSLDVLKEIPVVGNVDFGHTTPKSTIPIGGTAEIKFRSDACSLVIIHH